MGIESSTITILVFGAVVLTILYIVLHTNLVQDVNDDRNDKKS